MTQPLLVRAAVLAGAAVASLTAGGLVAPAAHADDELPPGLSRLPESSAAPLVAVPLTDPLGRKWR